MQAPWNDVTRREQRYIELLEKKISDLELALSKSVSALGLYL